MKKVDRATAEARLKAANRDKNHWHPSAVLDAIFIEKEKTSYELLEGEIQAIYREGGISEDRAEKLLDLLENAVKGDEQ